MWGEKIHYYRKKRGLTQSDLAEGVCSVSYLSKLEHNSIDPSRDIIIPLCERLNIQIDDHQTIDEVKMELKLLYKEVAEKKLNVAEEKLDKIRNQMKWIEDPNTIALFSLMDARYKMWMKEMEAAKKELELVKSYLSLLESEQKYFYFSFWGLYLYLTGHFPDSLEYYASADKIRHELNLNDPYFVYQHAMVHSRMNSSARSIISAQEALDSFNATSSFSKSVDCLILLGINYNRIGDKDNAKSYLKQALRATEYLVDNNNILVTIYHNLGFVFSSEGRSMEAISYYEKSLKLNEENVQTMYLLAKEYYLTSQFDKSLKQLQKGMKFVKGRESTYSVKFSILALKLEKNEETTKFEHLLIHAKDFFQDRNDIVNLLDVYIELGDYYSKKFSYKNASMYYKKALEMNLTYEKR
ncbi:tetratricopeptide repeat protein [Alkalihalobacillus sp. R86527]|uniref:tetratricopeptide repeat protein n=1 Tax=Alkalihalobacillus sp. R86527 TaxID=3093863 RepID=UPI0036708F1A